MSSTVVFRQIKGFKSWFFQRLLKKVESKKKKVGSVKLRLSSVI